MNRTIFAARSVAMALVVCAMYATPVLSASAQRETVPPCSPNARRADLTFTLDDMNGKPVHLADYAGKVIVLNFWATWCGPCKPEIHALVALQAKYGTADLQVLGVSVDDEPADMKPFAREFGINYPLLQGKGRDDIQTAYGPIWGVPMTFIIGRAGTICRTHRGSVTKETLEEEIGAFVRARPPGQ